MTELICQRAEELAAEERQYQSCSHDEWLEQKINEAFSRHDTGKSLFISNDEMNQYMKELKTRAARGEL